MSKSACSIRLIFSIIALSIAIVSVAQPKTKKYVLSGEAIDSTTMNGIEYATVAISGPDNQVISAAAADGTGRFSVEIKQAGNFKITISSLGYTPLTREIKVATEPLVQKLGKFYLTSGVDIKEVTVAIQKPLIKSDVDKLTYSVEADPEAQTSTLVDIMRKVPQLSVDAEDNVTLNGQSNYKVLVNGKSSSMFSKNFKDVIRSMPASSIKDIEVITNPSTKYEAEGAGGIINIITNKKNVNGYSGRVGAGIGSFGSYNGNAYFSAQISKLNFSTRYWLGRYGMPESRNTVEGEIFNSTTNNHSFSEGNGSGYYLSQGLSLEASYDIDTLNLITLSLWGYQGRSDNDMINESRYWQDSPDNLTRHFIYESDNSNKYGSISGSLDYQHTFKKPEHTFTLSYKLDNNPERSNYTNNITGEIDYDSYYKRSKMKSLGSEHTVQADYYNPISKMHQVEAGIKYIMRINTNESEAWKRLEFDDPWEIYNDDKNDLDYTQHIFGAYGGYLFKLKKFTAKAGLRMEGTINDGTAKLSTGEVRFDNKLFNVVPYVNLSYMLKPSQTLRLSYTQRLQRPGIWYLNPYLNDSDPMNTSQGNPELKSVISHSFSANYSIFSAVWNLYIGLNSSFANNNISRIKSVDKQTGVTSSTYGNVGKEQRYGANASYSYRLRTAFSVNCSFNMNYLIIESRAMDLKNEGLSYGGNLGMSVGLWKNANFRANGGLFRSSVSLQGSGSIYYYTSAGISQQLFKKKLDINISISNPQSKYRTYSNNTEDMNFRQHSEYRQRARNINFSLGYRFGKMDARVKKASRTISNDDKMEGGGNKGGGI